MAHRVAAVLILFFSIVSSVASANMRERAPLSEALLERWEEAYAGFKQLDKPSRLPLYYMARVMQKLHMGEGSLSVLRTLAGEDSAYSGLALELAVNDLFEVGEYDRIIPLAAASQAMRFKDPDTFNYQTGQAYFLLGDSVRAEARLVAVEAGPLRPYALHSLGLINFSKGNLREAMEYLSAGIEAVKVISDQKIARALKEKMRLTLGRVVYQSAMSMTDLAEENRVKLLSLAVEQFEAIGQDSLFFPEALRGIGWSMLELGDSARALASFESAASLDSLFTHEDYWAQGRIYQRLGHLEEAAKMYGKAAAEATKQKIFFAAGKTAVGYDSSMVRWTRLANGVAQSEGRLDRLSDKERLITVGINRKAEGLAVAEQRVEALSARGRVLAEELEVMAAGLNDYMDEISAVDLFPANKRAYLDRVIGLRDGIRVEIAYLDEIFSSFETSALWTQATKKHRDAAVALWKRLNKAKGALSESRYSFLLAMKDRVNVKKANLAQFIKDLRQSVVVLDEPRERTRAAILKAKANLETRRSRFASLGRFLRGLEEQTRSLGEQVNNSSFSEGRRRAEERAVEVGLLADAYMLDETEALHLLHEQRNPAAKEATP